MPDREALGDAGNADLLERVTTWIHG